MTKEELILELSQKMGNNTQLAESFLNAFIVTIQENLAKGEPVYIPELGTFEPKTTRTN